MYNNNNMVGVIHNVKNKYYTSDMAFTCMFLSCILKIQQLLINNVLLAHKHVDA